MHASPLYIGDGLGASANRKPVPVVSPNSHDRAILHHRYDWSVAVIEGVELDIVKIQKNSEAPRDS